MPILLLLLILFFPSPSCADVFQSEAMRQLWDVPAGAVSAETVKAYDQGRVRVEEIYYQSRPYNGEPVRIFGYFAYPRRRDGKLPAILLSHGGGGTASRPRAVAWAKLGYAVLAIDLPGKGERRRASRSTGPDMDLENLLRTGPDLSENYLVHAVAAARNGINYLCQRPEVDPDRTGMIGLSWGGVVTLLTNGQDGRLKAAVNVFGAGYIPEGCTWGDRFAAMPPAERARWDDYLDPKNFLASQQAPILFITGTNDHCYYLPTFQKSFQQVPVEKSCWLIPNLKHRFLGSAEGPALAWLEQKLKAAPAGHLFPTISELPVYKKKNGQVVIPVRTLAGGLGGSVRLYYNEGGPLAWTAKRWKAIVPYFADGVYFFGLPPRLLGPEILYYVSVKDERGGASSSLVRSLFKVKLPDGSETAAVSSPIRALYRHERPLTLLGGEAPDNFSLAFSRADKTYRLKGSAR
ncbi:MAG: acetylxylan esterase [Candidatus Saganbacteria bacterium]|nr:acetylxylan esterase [Candidatus Saganbacteria bacterium]